MFYFKNCPLHSCVSPKLALFINVFLYKKLPCSQRWFSEDFPVQGYCSPKTALFMDAVLQKMPCSQMLSETCPFYGCCSPKPALLIADVLQNAFFMDFVLQKLTCLHDFYPTLTLSQQIAAHGKPGANFLPLVNSFRMIICDVPDTL